MPKPEEDQGGSPRRTRAVARTVSAPSPPAGTYYGSPYGYDYGGYGAADGAEAHLMDHLRTLYRHRWVAFSVFAVVFLGVAVQTFTGTPIFRATTQLLLEPDNPNVVTFKEVIEQEKATNEYYQTQYTILKSRALARRTMDALKLWEEPSFGGGRQDAASFSLTGAVARAAEWVGGLFSSGEASQPKVPGPGENTRQSRMIDSFLANLTVSPVGNSRLVNVQYELPQAGMAAQVVNTLAKQYIEQNLEYKFLSTKEATDWLAAQLAEQRKKLEESEMALQRYREQGDAVALEDRQNIVVQRLADLNSAVTRAKTTRIEKEALYQQLSALQKDRRSLDTFPSILANSFIQQLKTQLADLQRQQVQMSERLGERHPDMIRIASEIQTTQTRLDAEINKVVQSVRNEYLAAQAQEGTLAADLERQKQEALALNRAGIEYSVLSREAESNKQIYEALMQRAKETGISGELKTSNIRVVDLAEVPRSPIKPNKRTNLLLGLLGGVFAGVGLAFFLEYLDHRVKNPQEIKQFLGIPFLGMIPAVGLDGTGDVPVLGAGVAQSFIEAFRAIRTNVVFSSAEEGPKTIAVTSSQPGEGKTVVASNLALVLAQSGKRVLMLDADMRKPRQHVVFKTRQDPGLSSLLVGQAKAGDAVRRTVIPGLWILPSGPHPPNPAELLGSDRFRRFLETLGQHFDWIVIDSPPVLAVTDPAVVAHRVTGVVFVIGSEQVNRAMAQRAVEQLMAARANILGAVLNRVNVDRDPYYYSHYYKADYANYYSDQPQT